MKAARVLASAPELMETRLCRATLGAGNDADELLYLC